MNLEAVIGKLVAQINQRLFDAMAVRGSAALPAPRAGADYELYLHIPFCRVLCPFCSFHRVKLEQAPADRYFDCLEKEIETVGAMGYRFDEVYIGGGTPTVMPDRLTRLLGRLREQHDIHSVSVETNPNELNRRQLERLAEAGVSRLSVGVQSFDDELLKGMQRYQTYGSGEQVQSALRRAGGVFDTLNVDMIFNLPRQTEASLRRDLDILTDGLAVDQVSFYPLMATPDNRAAMRMSMGTVDETHERRFYELIARHLKNAGYTRNSAWCFSRKPGMFDEYIVDREEYVGLGSGAFSYLDGALYSATFSNEQYAALIEQGGTGTVYGKVMSRQEQVRYYLLVKLFSGALRLSDAERRFGGVFQKSLWRELSGLRLIGAVTSTGDELRLTERGFYLWVVLMREFFSGVNRLRETMRYQASQQELAASAGESANG